jgi:hypothetical protein
VSTVQFQLQARWLGEQKQAPCADGEKETRQSCEQGGRGQWQLEKARQGGCGNAVVLETRLRAVRIMDFHNCRREEKTKENGLNNRLRQWRRLRGKQAVCVCSNWRTVQSG